MTDLKAHSRVRGAAVVGATVVAAELVFLAVHEAAGVDLAVRSGGTVTHVGAAAVAAVSLLVALAAWGLLALLQRMSARGRRIWTIVATVIFVVSLLGPLGAETAGATLGLAALHLIVAAVVIPGLRWESAR
ncbi:hypothetical protein DFJ67_4979 [Asanoa ferruginea]|uniref:Uncharacterized protein n=1 Tax=Asanoa ferruginea TaxID=53367 RepID=A0A3D9ZQN8_9ACTN|nr:DUF6069 family protein [Asanoa ferruginea]REF98954.1 hypothetical protein DFJ67_4979 [Asanoa ferruginea]GIF46364.1 hypothetical protein Afe04nite_09030 [Asanoa ferruginea]